MSGLAAGLVSAAFTFAVGILVDRFSYTPAFLVAGLMPLFATVCVFVLIRPPDVVTEHGPPLSTSGDRNLLPRNVKP
jgi:uncharacterized membrane protein (GlpM family)